MRYVILLGAAVVFASGCGTPGSVSYDFGDHTWNTDHGKKAEDPINHALVDLKSAVKRQYLGETYYFATEEDAKKFDATPDAFTYSDNPDLSDRPDRMDHR
jgi:YHS domain-containing protein